jgi:hypothetical protein
MPRYGSQGNSRFLASLGMTELLGSATISRYRMEAKIICEGRRDSRAEHSAEAIALNMKIWAIGYPA